MRKNILKHAALLSDGASLARLKQLLFPASDRTESEINIGL
jgi:hypothetical protein